MKVAIITDQHFGTRNDSIPFLDFFEKFYSETFFPKLDQEGIEILLILGDTFDRRKYVNFFSLKRTKQMFFDELQKRNIKIYMLAGNHDTYYKNTNEVNSVDLLLKEYNNIEVIDDPKTISLKDGDVETDILMLPWICQENYEESMRCLKESKSLICMGHFEIQGFQMYKSAPSHDGLEPSLFKKFDMTFSGHYHHKSERDNIYYLGSPYEMTWQDYEDPRGFHILEVEKRELQFIRNPNRIFHKIFYDDKKDDIKKITSMDLSEYKNTYVKIVVINKTNPYLFDVFVNNLYQNEPLDITIAEDFTELEDIADDEVNQAEDTVTILNKYIDNLSTDLKKDKLKDMFREIYIEALSGEEK